MARQAPDDINARYIGETIEAAIAGDVATGLTTA